MPKFVCNTNELIDWDSIVEICRVSNNGDCNTVTSVVDRSEAGAEGELLGRYRKLIDNWIQAGINLEEVEWFDYYPGEHFDFSVQDTIADLVNADPRRVFVSEVYPGKFVPWHWDIEDKEDEWLAQGGLVRYVVFMQKPQQGHMLPLEQHCFNNMPQGDIWKWDNYKDWHAGINLGTEPHYLFHFLGAPR
jgi:hypothetical protein